MWLIKHHAMKTYWGVEVYLHHSWARNYMEVIGQFYVLDILPPGNLPTLQK
jgi:hypothetical protein